MGLEVYTIEDSDYWDKVVKSFKEYDTYWLSGYVKGFKIHGDGEPLLFYYQTDTCKGINVVMKRDISTDEHFFGKLPPNKYWDFSTPYGYGGWLIEGKLDDNIFDLYEKWCKSNGIISEFVRFHPVIENHMYSSSRYTVVPLGNTVSLDITSPDIIWANLTSKNRNAIRKSEKNGIKIYNGRYPEIFDSFKVIYDQTMIRDDAEKYYFFGENFYKSILNDLPDNAQIFYAVYDNNVIASSIILFANERMNYHLSGSIREYSSLAATNLLLYKAALWGCENGYKSFYLGGGVGSGEDSLFKFKKAFYRKDDVRRFYIGKKIYLEEVYQYLCNIREKIVGGFFPAYRA